MALTYLRNPSIERLPVLLEWLRSGELRIPAFQREIVWTGDQRLSLCDTIRRGLPAGSMMVWRTKRENVDTERFNGPFKYPVDGSVGPRQYLLDGQQRLATLFAALGPALWTREGEAVPWRDPSDVPRAPDDTPWQVGFDLSDEGGGFLLIDGEQEAAVLPLSVLLDETAYDEWRTSYGLDRRETNRARVIRSAFVDYLVPVVPLATEDLETVTLTFKRVNTGGTKMGDFDMLRALSWRSTFDLEKKLDEIAVSQLEPLGWSAWGPDNLLKVIATAYGMEPVEIDTEKLSEAISARPKQLGVVAGSLAWAIDAVGQLGFLGPATLPYTYVLIFAARVWQEHGDLLPADKAKLEQWLVEAAISDRFAGGTPPHMIRAAWRDLAQKLGIAVPGRSTGRRDRKLKVRVTGGVNFGWGRPVVTAAILALQGPRQASGKAIPAPAEAVGQSGKDWYPRLLAAAETGGSKSGLHLTAANRIVCGPEHLAKLRGRIRQDDCPKAILRSHAIPAEAHQMLLKGDIDGFFEARFTRITALENAWLKSHGSSLRVP